MKKSVGYVVIGCEQMKDEEAFFARVFKTKDEVLEYLYKMANGFGGSNCTFEVFEIGKQIEITKKMIREPQPSKTKIKFDFKK